MPISGPGIVKFANEAPVLIKGSWNVGFSIPVNRSYGQGEVGADGRVKPGSGYNGSSLGTAQNVTGSFRFSVDSTGSLTKSQVLQWAYKFCTIDFGIGDPLAATVRAKAVDAHFDSITFENDSENGKFEISGTMSAGKIEGIEPDDL